MKIIMKRIDYYCMIKYIIGFLSIMYILVVFNSPLKNWYNTNVMPIVSQFKSHLFVDLIVLILVVVLGLDVFRKYQRRYRYDNKVTLALLIVSVLMIVCRASGDYDYVSFIGYISYVDVIVVASVSYIIAAVVNDFRLYHFLYKKDDGEHLTSSGDSILNDWPIESMEEDIFDFGGEVEKLADRIKSLDKRKTWSLAITAPWGTGKTSFLNLIEKQFSNSDFEILHFIPRDSKSYKSIQEDFFTSLACVLSKYDSRCNHIIKDYMASLQLIDNRGVIEKLIEFYRIWNKDSLKESIEKSFEALNKIIVVLVDDFDRLSKEEILEVLKLIDSNAAFKNLIFLTAYDKVQVNKTLGEENQSDDACFVDKFFNIEYAIPSRPYSYITKYIEDQLNALLVPTKDEQELIQSVFATNSVLIAEYLPTLRDAKRYFNQVSIDYQDVRGDVLVDEFLWVELIKYRYPILYKCIFKKEYVECGNILSGNSKKLYLKKGLDANLQILPILTILFSNQNSFESSSYHHIYDIQSFNNYFVNRIYNSLRIKDMQLVLSQEWEEALKTLNVWIQDGLKKKDFIDYLYSLQMDCFKDGASYIKYAEILAFLACKLPNSRAYALFSRIIYVPNLEGYDSKYNLDYVLYKKRLIEIITDNDPQLTLVAQIHVYFKTHDLDDSVQIIKDDDIWPFVKENFIHVVNDQTTDDMWILSRLRQCIIEMDDKRKLFLDADCLQAYRERIEKFPAFYIKNFVFLGAYSSNPNFNSIACEPFWKQIFQNETLFEKFLIKCQSDKIENIGLVWNFWQLYKANDFKQLEFENQGVVQDKIDNGLVLEIRELEKMKEIEKKVELIPIELQNLSDVQIAEYKASLLDYKKSLDDIKLDIKLWGKIYNSIDAKLQTYPD